VIHRRFILAFTATLSGLVAALAGINIMIDPLRVFDLVAVTAPLRQYSDSGGMRVYKAEALRREHWDVVILGSSRSQIGLNPAHPAFGDWRVYNAAVSATSLEEQQAILRYVLRHQRPRLILLGLDLSDFGEDAGRWAASFADTPFDPTHDPLEYYGQHLWGLAALNECRKTVVHAVTRRPPRHTPRGQDIRHTLVPGYSYYEHLTEALGPRRRNPLPFRFDRQHEQRLVSMIRACLKRGVRLVVLLHPLHAEQVERTPRPALRQFKRMVVGHADRLNARYGASPRTEVWDFMGYTRYHTQPLPRGDLEKTPFIWYWDPGHYKSELGDVMIAQILGRPLERRAFDPDPRPFGRRLTSANVESHLARLEQERRRWLERALVDLDAAPYIPASRHAPTSVLSASLSDAPSRR
jgi:hypothetical protein